MTTKCANCARGIRRWDVPGRGVMHCWRDRDRLIEDACEDVEVEAGVPPVETVTDGR